MCFTNKNAQAAAQAAVQAAAQSAMNQTSGVMSVNTNFVSNPTIFSLNMSHIQNHRPCGHCGGK